MSEIRVLIVDDHPVFRDGLRRLLDDSDGFAVAAEAAHGAEALAVLATSTVDIVLMDLNMPTMDGVETTRRIRADHPESQVLVLTTYDTDDHVLPAIESGALGYLLKDAPREELLRAISAAARGETVLSPAAARHVMKRLNKTEPAILAPREIELLELVAEGATNKEAAARLMVSEATVKAYLLRIYPKLGARDRASAVSAAYRKGLLP